MSKRRSLSSTSLLSFITKIPRKDSGTDPDGTNTTLTSTSMSSVRTATSSCSTSTSQADFSKLDSIVIASDDIASILPPASPSELDKLRILDNAFRPIGDEAKTFDFKKCCTAKGHQMRHLNENHFKTYPWLVYSRAHGGLYCKYCTLFAPALVGNGIGKNRQKPGRLVVQPLCTFNRLTGTDGYLNSHDKLAYHKSCLQMVS